MPLSNQDDIIGFSYGVQDKKIIWLCLLPVLFLSYGQKAESSMRLDEKFVIDLEDPSVSDQGLYGLDSFAVGTEGEI